MDLSATVSINQQSYINALEGFATLLRSGAGDNVPDYLDLLASKIRNMPVNPA